jgi:AcrR family transcriptional regulator
MSRDKRDSILQAALKLFVRFGRRRTTVDQIARTAGVGKGTIYTYFAEGKRQIWDELVAAEADKLINCIRLAVEEAVTFTEKLRACAVSHFRCIHEELALLSIEEDILDEYFPEIDEVRESFLKLEHELLVEILQGGVAAGEFRPIDIDLLAFTFIAALRGLELPWIWQQRVVDTGERISTLLDVLFNGLLAPEHQGA